MNPNPSQTDHQSHSFVSEPQKPDKESDVKYEANSNLDETTSLQENVPCLPPLLQQSNFVTPPAPENEATPSIQFTPTNSILTPYNQRNQQSFNPNLPQSYFYPSQQQIFPGGQFSLQPSQLQFPQSFPYPQMPPNFHSNPYAAIYQANPQYTFIPQQYQPFQVLNTSHPLRAFHQSQISEPETDISTIANWITNSDLLTVTANALTLDPNGDPINNTSKTALDLTAPLQTLSDPEAISPSLADPKHQLESSTPQTLPQSQSLFSPPQLPPQFLPIVEDLQRCTSIQTNQQPSASELLLMALVSLNGIPPELLSVQQWDRLWTAEDQRKFDIDHHRMFTAVCDGNVGLSTSALLQILDEWEKRRSGE